MTPFCFILLRRLLVAAAVVGSTTCVALAQTQTIDFEDQSGPSRFSTANPPLQILSATFSGGQILTHATKLLVDPTTVYGTASFCTGCSPVITIQFNSLVSSVNLLLMNGEPSVVSCTVEDNQGNSQTITLPPYLLSGAQTVNIPGNNIRTVTIESFNGSQWDFEIDNVIFTAIGPRVIDPVASGALNGASVTTNVNTLASAHATVQGISADGVTQTVVQIPAAAPGQTFRVYVINDQNNVSSSLSADGGLVAIGGNVRSPSSIVTVTAANTALGPMAFAIYRAPRNFVRNLQDEGMTSRYISLQIVATNTRTTAVTYLTVVRPPVVLIHGLWDRPASWQGFAPLYDDSRFTIDTVDYSNVVYDITRTVPSYNVLFTVEANSLGFAYNAPSVLGQIQNFISTYRLRNNVAAVTADIVAHSMGGDISRTMGLLPEFLTGSTFAHGPIDKFITIGTPHLGTPLATQILQTANSCTRGLFAPLGNVSLQSVSIGNSTFNGAVGDLQGDGFGGGLSAALTALAPEQFPTAYIAGIMTSNNLSGLTCTACAANVIRHICYGDTLANNLTAMAWPFLFGQLSDSVVPLQSQLNRSPGVQVSGVVHSGGMVLLGFAGPSELDQSSTIAARVITLLNEGITGPDFNQP
jgi:pimeloyl-ACP methyl ester carboxylesterase